MSLDMRELLRSNYHWVTLFVLILLVGLVDPNFWNLSSLLILLGDIVPLFIMALGLTFARLFFKHENLKNVSLKLVCLIEY